MKFFRLTNDLQSEASAHSIKQVVWALQREKTVVLPTDTFYALSGDAQSRRAVEAIVDIKGRSPGQPLPALVRDLAQAELIAVFGPRVRYFLWQAWPGKLTAVLPIRSGVSCTAELISEQGRIGLRVADHPFLRALFGKYGGCLVGTSANRSGLPPARSVEHFLEQLTAYDRKPDVIIDAGRLPESAPSTVVELNGGHTPHIIRHGAVSAAEVIEFWQKAAAYARQ